MPERKRDRIAITCPPGLQARLRAYTKRTHIPYSEMIRLVTAAFLDRWERTGEALPPECCIPVEQGPGGE